MPLILSLLWELLGSGGWGWRRLPFLSPVHMTSDIENFFFFSLKSFLLNPQGKVQLHMKTTREPI